MTANILSVCTAKRTTDMDTLALIVCLVGIVIIVFILLPFDRR